MVDIVIVGAGPAGMTAALYATRSGMSVKLFEDKVCGGQMTETQIVENYPSIQNISGWKLAEQMQRQILEYGVEIKYLFVTGIKKTTNGFCVKTEKEDFIAKSIIIANGVKHRHLNCKGENSFIGKGVSWCSVCDGNFYKNKITAVIGGGNKAAEDALYLASVCKKVFLIHRRQEFRAEKELMKSVFNNNKIEIKTPYNINEIIGTDKVNGIEIINAKSHCTEILSIDGVFEAVGLKPENSAFSNLVELDNNGYIIADESCKTSCAGIFVAGDTRTKVLRQIITATTDGAVAAKGAFEFVNMLNYQ